MKDKKIYIAGHKGMVGSAIYRKYSSEGYTDILTRSFEELDLTRQSEVESFFEAERPDEVILAAAKVGGILANNTYRAEFIYENLMIEANIIHSAYSFGVKKLLFLGSSCIYPRLAPQPLREEYLLSGELEGTNEPYAIAKISGIKLTESYFRQYGSNFISVMPTNLYGPFDNFELERSHVLPALIRKFHEAKANNSESVEVWGTGSPRREFLYVDDLADAVYYIMNNVEAKDLYEGLGISHINIGTGQDLRISELVEIISEVVGFKGKISYDSSKPDGTPRKLMDISRLHSMGWHHRTSLRDGIMKAYNWFLENYQKK